MMRLSLYLALTSILILRAYAVSASYDYITLSPQQSHLYANAKWHPNSVSAIGLDLYPIAINVDHAKPYQFKNSDYTPNRLENLGPPDILDTLVWQHVQQTKQFNLRRDANLRLQIQVSHYQPLYYSDELSLANRIQDKLESLFETYTRSQQQSRVILNFHLYQAETNSIITKFSVVAELSECWRSTNPNIYADDGANGTKLIAYAKSVIGQTFIAALNKGLERIHNSFSGQHVYGNILAVNTNNLWLNLGQGYLNPGDEVRVLYHHPEQPFLAQNKRMARGHLRVIESFPDYSIAVPLDIKMASLVTGDTFSAKHPAASAILSTRSYIKQCVE